MGILHSSRRQMLKNTFWGSLFIPTIDYFSLDPKSESEGSNKLFYRYPAISDEMVSAVVGASHFDFDKVQSLVEERPELAKATWDWGFGDFESALGAASHVGRRDIASYLMQNGARPDIFTYAMMGAVEVVEQMIKIQPEIVRLTGPHDFSLLHHAKVGLRMKDDLSAEEIRRQESLIAYIEGLEGSNGKEYETLNEEEKEMYLGDYRYGDGEGDGFSVRLNMRKLLAFGKLGSTGGALFKIGEHTFTYNGAPSVRIVFEVVNKVVKGLTIHESDLVLKAVKLSS